MAAMSGRYDVIFMGGSIRSGKTYCALAYLIILAKIYPNSKHIVVRKSLNRLRDTVLPTFYQIAPGDFIVQDPNQSNGWECKFANGSMIKFYQEAIEKDPQLKRMRGLEADMFFFDEMDVQKQTFYMGIERSGTHRMKERAEGTYTCPRGVICTSNPQRGWVKELFYDPHVNGTLRDNWLYMNFKVEDNPHISKEWIQLQRENLPALRAKIMLDGDWNVNMNSLPFFYEFSREFLKDKLVPLNREPLYLSFDFNYSPTTCIVGQKIEDRATNGGGLYIYAEYSVEGGTHNLCQHLKGYQTHPAGLYITGDFSGATRHTSSQSTDYEIIQEDLSIPAQWFINTNTANKDFTYSRNLCNYAFLHGNMSISRTCHGLINDIETAQVDDKGKLIKDRNAHCQDLGDAFRYLIDAWFPRGVGDINTFHETMYGEIMPVYENYRINMRQII